jgi:hypothetical protein
VFLLLRVYLLLTVFCLSIVTLAPSTGISKGTGRQLIICTVSIRGNCRSNYGATEIIRRIAIGNENTTRARIIFKGEERVKSE